MFNSLSLLLLLMWRGLQMSVIAYAIYKRVEKWGKLGNIVVNNGLIWVFWWKNWIFPEKFWNSWADGRVWGEVEGLSDNLTEFIFKINFDILRGWWVRGCGCDFEDAVQYWNDGDTEGKGTMYPDWWPDREIVQGFIEAIILRNWSKW